MPTARLAAMLMLSAVLALPACKPAPADVGSAQAANLPLLPRPSQPIDSPDTANAVWVASGGPLRLVYGVPGESVLLALQCEGAGTPEAQLQITRHAPADRGASALLALIGNGRIGRFPVDATRVRGQLVWQGAVPAARPEWEALTPLREATVTVPGAGLVKLNPSPLPMQLVEACRGQPETPAPAPPAAPA